nr:retrovirus-related Pol polyprotein from transposon TNT 1-94 [Tanacetum cinerariifolium]
MSPDSKPKVYNSGSSKFLRPKPIQKPQLKCELCHYTNYSTDDCYRILYCMICKKEDHRTSDHEMYTASLKRSENYKAQPFQYASPSMQILKAKAKPFPPCTQCGFNDHRPNDYRNYPKYEIYGSYDQFTLGHNCVIHIRGEILAESSQYSKSLIDVKCNICGSTIHSTTDHNEFNHFKRETHQGAILYLESGCSRSMTGVKSYLHKYVKQPGPKDHLSKFDAKADDEYFLGYSFNFKAFRVFNTRRQQIKELIMLPLMRVWKPSGVRRDLYVTKQAKASALGSSSSQAVSKVQKYYKAEYKKMKAKLALLEVKVLMALADDELSVGKNHARNGSFTKLRGNVFDLSTLLSKREIWLRILYCMICKKEDHRTLDHEMYTASLKRSENYKAQPFQGEILAESSQYSKSSIDVKCNICGSTIHSITDHNEFNHFKREIHQGAILYLESGCSWSMTGVKSYLHKYVKQPGPKDRWSKDQHIEPVNIIGDPSEGMLTRSMAAKLTTSECLFANFLFEILPKKVSEALRHPGWVDVMQEELN